VYTQYQQWTDEQHWQNYIALRMHCMPAGAIENGNISGVGVRLKVGDRYWEEWRGGSGEGLCPPSWGTGAWLRKKIIFALKIMQFWASFGTGTSFLYHSKRTFTMQKLKEKVGDYPPPVLKVGDLSLPPPCSDAYEQHTPFHRIHIQSTCLNEFIYM